MPDGGAITIAARVEDVAPGHSTGLNPGRYVCFSVEDAGEGMDEARLARAIDPFFTTKGVGKGTGLGLPMVQGIAEQSGGRFVLRSTLGVGTTAEIWLQAADDLQQSGRAPAPAAVPTAGSRPLLVLAVDDDVLVLMNTAAMLEDLGHTALEAGSAHEALKLLRENPRIDLVVTDQAMPGMTGVQLAEVIREERPDLPVILATGYAELPDGLGAQLPKLAKPFGQVQLEDIIARTVEASPASGGRVIVLGERLPRKPVA